MCTGNSGSGYTFSEPKLNKRMGLGVSLRFGEMGDAILFQVIQAPGRIATA